MRLEYLFAAMQGAVSQGVLWGIMTMGVFITFKVLDFADMTVDGSFALGGAVSAVLIVHGVNIATMVLWGTSPCNLVDMQGFHLKFPPKRW